MKLARHEVTIDAAPSVVYRHLTEAAGLLRWLAIDAVVDAVPGGELRWTHENGATVVGRFVELLPPRRVVFTYGWEDGRMGLPPNSSVVEIDLEEEEGRTTLRLVHRGLPPQSVDSHRQGWSYFFQRLRDTLSPKPDRRDTC